MGISITEIWVSWFILFSFYFNRFLISIYFIIHCDIYTTQQIYKLKLTKGEKNMKVIVFTKTFKTAFKYFKKNKLNFMNKYIKSVFVFLFLLYCYSSREQSALLNAFHINWLTANLLIIYCHVFLAVAISSCTTLLFVTLDLPLPIFIFRFH